MNDTNSNNRAPRPNGGARRPSGAAGAPARARGAAARKRGAAGVRFDAGGLAAGFKRLASRIAAGFRGLAKRLAAGVRKRRAAKAARPPRERTNLLKSKFYRIYFALLALSAIVIAVACVWLNAVLEDYESAQPVYVARQVAQVFEDRDFEALYAMDASAAKISDGDESFYLQSMREITDGRDIAWSEAFSPDENERRYNVTVGSDRFATFTLVPSGETTSRGNRLWKLGDVSTNVILQRDVKTASDCEYRITAPEDYTITVDGVALTEANVIRTGITLLPDSFLPSGVTEPQRTEYGFDADSAQPSIRVTDRSGAEQEVRQSGDKAWTSGPADDAAFREKYAGGIAKVAQQMAKFTAKDVSNNEMLRNVADDSPAYSIIKRFSNYWAPTHKETEFNNMKITDCIFWSDTCFTCHVTFDFLLRTRRGTEMTYPTAYTFCFISRKGGAKLYNLQMN